MQKQVAPCVKGFRLVPLGLYLWVWRPLQGTLGGYIGDFGATSFRFRLQGFIRDAGCRVRWFRCRGFGFRIWGLQGLGSGFQLGGLGFRSSGLVATLLSILLNPCRYGTRHPRDIDVLRPATRNPKPFRNV